MLNHSVREQSLSEGNNGQKVTAPLGSETLNDIEETLLPSDPTHKVFFIKKFSNRQGYRWFVVSVALSSAAGVTPAVYSVVLSKVIHPVPEEYLRQTLKKSPGSVNRRLWQGVLVEVDYGFVQSVGKTNGEIRTNKRYSDTLQHGEMHKRRLAVVIKTSGNLVQIAPITSDPKSASDKTCFELTRKTLDDLTFYGASGKRSWVLCNMLETVSTSRILPPATNYTARGRSAVRSGRNTNYTQRLSADEMKLLRASLLNVIGVSDYIQMKESLAVATQECLELGPLRDANRVLADEIASLKAKCTRLALIEEVAKDWEKQMGSEGMLEQKALELREFYEQVGATA